MGCGSAKAKAPEKDSNSGQGTTPLSTAELKEVEESQSFGSIKSASKSGKNGISPGGTDIPGEVPEPVSFEIPALSDEESIVKKHPPKRLQRLEDQQPPDLTLDLMEEKQKEVEDRRQHVLNERVQSSRRSARHRRPYIGSNPITDQIEEGEAEIVETKSEETAEA